MATARLILDKRSPKQDGTFPVKIAISQRGQTTYLPCGVSVPGENWNGLITGRVKTIDNVQRENNRLLKQLNEAIDMIEMLRMRHRLHVMTARQIKNFILNAGSEHSVTTFNEYLTGYTKLIKNPSTREKYENTLKAVERFTGDAVFFDDINLAWLNRFREWRLQDAAPATTNIDLRNIRTLFNRAIDVDEILPRFLYPFNKFNFVPDKPRNLRLDVETIKAIRDFSGREVLELTRDWWMLSFYLVGMNTADMYRIYDISSGRVKYNRKKTKKEYDLLIQPEAAELFERHKGFTKLLRFQERYNSALNMNSIINDNLKDIGAAVGVPRLVMYHARHSWAGLAAKKPIGASKWLIQQALGHGKRTVTDGYFDYDIELVDDLNRKVLDLLL